MKPVLLCRDKHLMFLNVEESYASENAICSKVLISYNTAYLNKAVFYYKTYFFGSKFNTIFYPHYHGSFNCLLAFKTHKWKTNYFL